MTHFSQKPGMVRVDIFKESGKWYDTLELDMDKQYNTLLIHDAINNAMAIQHPQWTHGKNAGFHVVVLDPYHKNSHPVMYHI